MHYLSEACLEQSQYCIITMTLLSTIDSITLLFDASIQFEMVHFAPGGRKIFLTYSIPFEFQNVKFLLIFAEEKFGPAKTC